ncbi:serine hydrolase [Streptomyces anulatus]|uniref:serine hydrolase n=1 Tax=Streptomyces anulatus TaxID=1892 RepID=UPI0034036143
MTGIPSLADLVWARGYTDPAWARRHTTPGRELVPSRSVWRGSDGASALPTSPAGALDDLTFTGPPGQSLTLAELRARAETDALLVMHRGLLVHEEYLHGYDPHIPHFNASAAKSYLGLVAAVLAHEGQLDRGAQVSKYVPELAGTAFGDAQVDHLLHMGTQVSYASRPYDKALEAQRYFGVLAPNYAPSATPGRPRSANTSPPPGRPARREPVSVTRTATSKPLPRSCAASPAPPPRPCCPR